MVMKCAGFVGLWFHSPFPVAQVQEDADIGATVARVTALDADVGENARVTYDLLSTWGTDLFQLDSVLGTFTLIGNLDYELVSVLFCRLAY